MRLAAAIAALMALAGCGSTGFEGTLDWAQTPSVSAHSLKGRIRNTTSHSVTVDPKAMRLLDDRGRKVTSRIHVGGGTSATTLPAKGATGLSASWKSGKPVRIDYGAGTLALPSG